MPSPKHAFVIFLIAVVAIAVVARVTALRKVVTGA